MRSTSARTGGEQPHGDHAGDLVELTLERDRVGDGEAVDVEDVVAVVGHEPLAPHRVAAAGAQLPHDQGARHGDHLDRQREAPERRHQLGVVDDAQEAPRRRGDDLLAGERTAAALHEVARGGRLVCAIDVEVEPVELVQVGDGDAGGAQPRAAGFGAGHRGAHAPGIGGECLDEQIDGRAGADADDRIVCCQLQGGERGAPLLCIRIPHGVLQRNDCARVRAGTVFEFDSAATCATAEF